MSKSVSRLLAAGRTAYRTVHDNWQNVMTGLGTARDKTQFGRFIGLQPINEAELTNLYHQDDSAKKAVSFKPQEMMRQGFTIDVGEDPDAGPAVTKKLKGLRAAQKIRDAMIWGRLYGGAGILIGADDGQEAFEPLAEDRIKTIKFLTVIDKRHLWPESFFVDPNRDDLFGEPEIYRVSPRRGGAGALVHRSRLLLFGGAHTSPEEQDRLGGWDYSVLQASYPVLRQFNNVWQSVEHLMSDASQGVMKIKGLMEMIAGGQKDLLATRMELVDMSRSVARALLLDADGESFERKTSNFSDVSSMLEKFMMRFSAAVDIPVTLLMGRSPAGLNATGESDFRLFYDTVRTAQENDLLPELEYLVKLCLLSQDGPTGGKEPEAWSVKFNALWQPTEKEQAETEKLVADKDKIYIDGQVLLPEEVALSRYPKSGWSSTTTIDTELRVQMLETSKKALEEPEPEPPPPVPEEDTDPEEDEEDTDPEEDEED